jgi:hypothetical protein
MPLPTILGGPSLGTYDPRQPTLLPNFDRVVASGTGTMDRQS